MALDQETVETIAPVLAMIGQQVRLDSNWACHMIEAVGGQALPEFYRQQRDLAQDADQRIHYGLKLASSPSGRIDDKIHLAQAYADKELLVDSLYWIGKAIQSRPEAGEYLRFKASILERMGSFDEALLAAEKAELLGADAVAIRADIERIQGRWTLHLRQASRSPNLAKSLRSYVALLEKGKVRFRQIPTFLVRVIRLYARTHRTQ